MCFDKSFHITHGNLHNGAPEPLSISKVGISQQEIDDLLPSERVSVSVNCGYNDIYGHRHYSQKQRLLEPFASAGYMRLWGDHFNATNTTR